MRKKLNLGVFGFGCVGQGLFHVLQETKGVKAEIKKICVKSKDKIRSLDPAMFTYHYADIIKDPDIDVVVELIDDPIAAFDILRNSLAAGKAVVTANKKMLAENLEEIYFLQQHYGRPVLYEGSVCGSIPIIRNLEEYYDNDLIVSIEGIFNGSTNYILTKVIEERNSYDDALRQAQEAGFAETDPSLDVKGFDPKYKLAILIAHTFGVFVSPERIINFGIDKISPVDLKYASDHGLVIKLIARAFKSDDKIYGLVAPQYVESSNPLASIRNEFNAVAVEGAFSERQLFVGKGAGGNPTASAVLSDISALTYDYCYGYKKLHQSINAKFTNDGCLDVVVTFSGEEVTTKDFEEFKGGFRTKDQQNFHGLARLEKIQEWYLQDGINVVVVAGASFVPYTAKVTASLL